MNSNLQANYYNQTGTKEDYYNPITSKTKAKFFSKVQRDTIPSYHCVWTTWCRTGSRKGNTKPIGRNRYESADLYSLYSEQ